MTYTVSAIDPTRPLNSDPRKQGAEELRALKLRVNTLATTLASADTSNANAIATVASNLAAHIEDFEALVTQVESADTTLASGITNALNAANSAASDATAALAAAALSVVKVKSIQVITSGSGNVTVPTGSVSCLSVGRGGDWQGYNSDDFTIGTSSATAAPKAVVSSVTEGASIAYSIGVKSSGVTAPTNTTFGGSTFDAAPKVTNNSGASVAWTASNGWLLLLFY